MCYTRTELVVVGYEIDYRSAEVNKVKNNGRIVGNHSKVILHIDTFLSDVDTRIVHLDILVIISENRMVFEIESQVIKSDVIRDCACVPVDDAVTGQAPKLFIALEPDAEYDAKAFKSFLAEVLDASKQPKIVEIIDEIPRTFNGKIKRNELMER